MSSDARHEAEQALIALVVGREFPQFSKQTYAPALQACTEELRGIFEPLSVCRADSANDVQVLGEELADTLLKAIREDLKTCPRVQRPLRHDAYRMFLATFLSPALAQVGDPLAQTFCESLRLQWQAAWPKQAYRNATAEAISAGFDKKWYRCYITQAACEYLGKSDDCAELTAFRGFRDGYLKRCRGGEQLIAEYYRTAPEIVRRIAFHADRDRIYEELWRRYLAPCFDDLCAGRERSCKARYCRMVRTLEKQFLPRGFRAERETNEPFVFPVS